MKNIESYLRENKPQVKDNPAFLLEVQQKMRAVEGIKSEVDRQRQYGRQALVFTLFAGLILGGIVTAATYLYPINPDSTGESFISDIMMVIEPWKHYIMLLATCCAIALGLIYSRRKETVIGF